MFKNSSNNIKTVAEVICFIGVLFSVFFGIAKILNTEVLLGISIIILGSLSFWVVSLILYGFGELIENSHTLIETLKQNNTNNSTKNDTIPVGDVVKRIQTAESNDRYNNQIKDDIVKKMIEGKIKTLEDWQKEGKITEEEFNEKKKELLGI